LQQIQTCCPKIPCPTQLIDGKSLPLKLIKLFPAQVFCTLRFTKRAQAAFKFSRSGLTGLRAEVDRKIRCAYAKDNRRPGQKEMPAMPPQSHIPLRCVRKQVWPSPRMRHESRTQHNTKFMRQSGRTRSTSANPYLPQRIKTADPEGICFKNIETRCFVIPEGKYVRSADLTGHLAHVDSQASPASTGITTTYRHLLRKPNHPHGDPILPQGQQQRGVALDVGKHDSSTVLRVVVSVCPCQGGCSRHYSLKIQAIAPRCSDQVLRSTSLHRCKFHNPDTVWVRGPIPNHIPQRAGNHTPGLKSNNLFHLTTIPSRYRDRLHKGKMYQWHYDSRAATPLRQLPRPSVFRMRLFMLRYRIRFKNDPSSGSWGKQSGQAMGAATFDRYNWRAHTG
jgi:hypothetical protein